MNSSNRKLEQTSYNQRLAIEASLENKQFNYNKIQPTAFFWKQIATNLSQAPLCLVPDTLILNEKQSQLMWIYTDQSGRVTRQTNINFKDFVYKLTSYSSPNELVAILKRPIFNQKLTYSNDFKLLNSRYLINSSQQQIGQKQCVMCLQRFVKSNGSKAFLCRTIFSLQSSSQCYLITNTRNFLDKNQPENKKFIVKPGDRSTIVKSKQGKNLEQTSKYLKNIVQFMKFFRGIDITQIIGDFIKDQMGNWWLINIKAFKLIEKMKKDVKVYNKLCIQQQFEKQRYQKTKICRYCQRSYLQSEFTYKMTMRMIIEVDKYLLHAGKEYNWLKRSDISNIDSHCLYQEHKVCQRCFRLYSQIQQLMKIENKLLARQGFQLSAHPKELIFSQTNEQHLRLQAKNKQMHRISHEFPQVIELGPNTNITTVNDYPVKNDQIINKMTRFRLIIFLNEIDQVTNINPELNYYLEFTLFGKKSKYRLNLQLTNHKIIPLNKLKIYYFFANSIESLQEQFISSESALKIYITTQHKDNQQKRNIGHLELPFKDLFPVNRKKDYYKFFHVENVPYGWGLQGSIGIISSDGQVTTAKISFQKSEGKIYIPNENFYFCQHLTQQWIDLIKSKNKQRTNQELLKSSDTRILKEISCENETRRISYLRGNRSTNIEQIRKNEINQISLNKQDESIIKANPSKQWQNILQNQIKNYQKSNKQKTKLGKIRSRPKLF